MKKRKLICFDLDNTLIDSDRAHIAAYAKAFAKNKLKKVKDSELKKRFGRVGKIIIHELFPQLSSHQVEKVLKDHHNFLIKNTAKFAKPIAGAKTVLKKLKKDYELALTTNCSVITALALMRGAGIDKKLFDVIIGHDKVRHPKPSPDEIIKAEHLIHLDAAFMVGDTPYDIIAGKKSKTKVIAVLTGNHSRKQLALTKPFKIVKSVKDILKIVQ